MSQASGRILHHTRCPSCASKGRDKSADNLATFESGWKSCIVCGYKEPPDKPYEQEDMTGYLELSDIAKLPTDALHDRGISHETTERYGVRVEFETETGLQVAYYAPLYRGGSHVGYQRKVARAPGMREKGDVMRLPKGGTGGADPFGAHIVGSKGKFLIVVEGMEDTLASSELLARKGKKYRVVGTMGTDAWKDQLGYYEGWEKVVICFDPDEPGQEAAEKFAAALKPGQAYIMRLNDAIGDPNAYLNASQEDAFMDALNNAGKFQPDGIINGKDTWDIYKAKTEQAYIAYPPEWTEMCRKMYGMREGEISVWTGGTGLGKSSIMRELLFHVLKTTKRKIGGIFLEDGVGDTVQGLMELALNKRISLPDVRPTVSPEEERKAWEKLFITGRVEFVKHEGAIEDEGVLAKIRHLIYGCGCTFIELDHITIAVSEGGGEGDNKRMDAFMGGLHKIVKAAPVHIAVVSHLRKTKAGSKSFEDGAIPTDDDLKGSGSLKQLAWDIIAASRNKMAADPIERNKLRLHGLKCRKTGRTGDADVLLYDDATGRLNAYHEDATTKPGDF